MPKKNRTYYYEAMYHVMLRGNYRQSIFNDNEDRLYFYSLLENTIEKFNFKVHVFCLMTNHIHFVIEIKFASSYAGYSNRKYNRSGHLFQGRYKAKLIQDEKYLLTLCYLHPPAKILSEDRSRKTVLARSLFAYFAHYYAHYTIKEVSQMLIKETETVSRTMHRNLRMMQKNNILKISIIKIEKNLKKLG